MCIRDRVQVVDGGVLDQGGVPGRIHPGGDGPDHVLPVPGVDVVIADDHELGVHELAQEGPDPQHHPLGVARVTPVSYTHLIVQDEAVKQKIDAIWDELKILD